MARFPHSTSIGLSIAFVVIGTISVAAPVPVPVEKEPEWMQGFRDKYQLQKDEYVKRVAAPYIPERIDFRSRYFKRLPDKDAEIEAKRRSKEKQDEKWMTNLIEQDGTKLKMRYVISSIGLSTMPEKHRGDNLFEVSEAVSAITGLETPEFIVDPKHIDHFVFHEDNRTVHGDFVTRKNAPLDKLAPQLEKILRDECKIPVKLRVDIEEQDVFVVGGTFALKPPLWRRQDAQKRMQKLIDIYATEDGLNPFFDHYEYQRKYDGRVNSSDYGGRPTDLVRFVGRRVKTRIVWDVELPSEPYFFWCNHELKTPTIQEKADDCDPDKVLKNVAAQTGLTFTKKKRKVPVLVISSSE